MHGQPFPFSPDFDLRFERTVDLSPEEIWTAWTTPALLMQWFTPAPWKTTACELDLRPGGKFYTTMQSPEGQQLPNEGCYLEIVPSQRLVWTTSLTAGYRPSSNAPLMITAAVEFFANGTGTRYVATAVHKDKEARDQHAAMGFEMGWGLALDQLVALMKFMKSG